MSEVTLKADGYIWRIHNVDADPFPSNPHAHNVESGLKLDLGPLYLGATATGRSIHRKDLLALRELAAHRGIALPHLNI